MESNTKYPRITPEDQVQPPTKRTRPNPDSHPHSRTGALNDDNAREQIYKRSRHGSRSKSHSPDSRSSGVLPYDAKELSRHELQQYRPLLALYLEEQKGHNINDMSEHEIKGRWKSFIGKWNRGEFPTQWYSPRKFQQAVDAVSNHNKRHRTNNQDDDDEFGPSLPSTVSTLENRERYTTNSQTFGPSQPLPSEVYAQRADKDEQDRLDRLQAQSEFKHQRKADRTLQKQRLEELNPRPEPGSRDRQLEKKRELAASNREFANSRHDRAGEDLELRDADVMGADDGDELRRLKKETERKKNERELRKEEMLRARRAEREERLRGLKEKEDKTMGMFKEIARQRFGDGSGS